MRRAVLISFASVLALGIAWLLVTGGRMRSDGFSVGVVAAGPVVDLKPGDSACQTTVGLPDRVDGVEIVVGPPGAPGGPVEVSLVAGDGRTVASGRLPEGTLTGAPAQVRLPAGRVREPVAVCVRNRGDSLVQPWGDVDGGPADPTREAAKVFGHPTLSSSNVHVGGVGTAADLSLVFTGERGSVLARLGTLFARAATFKLGIAGAWTYWLLLVAALAAAPVLLLRALDETEDAP